MMSEDIHKWATDGRYTLMFDEHTFFVFDNVKEERMTALETTKRLNKQQDTIFKLQDLCGKSDGENAKLRIENKQLRKQIQNYEQLISNSYVGEEETLDGFVGKYVIWENELQKYRKKNTKH